MFQSQTEKLSNVIVRRKKLPSKLDKLYLDVIEWAKSKCKRVCPLVVHFPYFVLVCFSFSLLHQVRNGEPGHNYAQAARTIMDEHPELRSAFLTKQGKPDSQMGSNLYKKELELKGMWICIDMWIVHS